ncbi:MAG: hypothetical protein IKO99_04115 [Bacteroidales bacterium]|nr:hypothetical protein [Bacteroidales bacterium]
MENYTTIGNMTAASFDAVMSYLHSIPISYETKKFVYKQLGQEIYETHHQKMKDRLKQISDLKQGWDGYDGLPIKEKTVENFVQFLNVCDFSDVADWSLFPNTNGTLLLEQKNASISIASKEFSYYAESQNRYMEAERQPYTLRSFLETLKTINSFLKNDR